jgi:hypothetical protein
MPFTVETLRSMSDEELTQEHNRQAGAGVPVELLVELEKRDVTRQIEQLVSATQVIKWLLVVIALLALANIGLVVLAD